MPLKKLNLEGSYSLDKETRAKMVGFMIGDIQAIKEAAEKSFAESDPTFLSKASHKASFTLSILQDDPLNEAIANAKNQFENSSRNDQQALGKLLQQCNEIITYLESESDR